MKAVLSLNILTSRNTMRIAFETNRETKWRQRPHHHHHHRRHFQPQPQNNTLVFSSHFASSSSTLTMTFRLPAKCYATKVSLLSPNTHFSTILPLSVAVYCTHLYATGNFLCRYSRFAYCGLHVVGFLLLCKVIWQLWHEVCIAK